MADAGDRIPAALAARAEQRAAADRAEGRLVGAWLRSVDRVVGRLRVEPGAEPHSARAEALDVLGRMTAALAVDAPAPLGGEGPPLPGAKRLAKRVVRRFVRGRTTLGLERQRAFDLALRTVADRMLTTAGAPDPDPREEEERR